jgi:transcriptional/translational regulatory protein YebC/TACO1
MFDKKGYIAVERDKLAEDKLMEIALEAGADDLLTDDPDYFEIYTAPEALNEVKTKIEAKGVPVAASEVSMIPQTPVKLDDAKSAQLVKLMEAIEEHDDVQNVWTAAELPESA